MNRRPPKPVGNLRLTVDADTTLLAFLEQRLPGSTRRRLRQRMKFHGVRRSGDILTRADTPLAKGDVLEILRDKIPETKLPHGLKVLWHDEHLLAVHKPAGLLTVASDTEKRETAYFHLTSWVRSQSGDPTRRLFIVHRLDREASGLLLFARSETVKEHLQNHWMQVEKIYSVIVSPPPNPPMGIWKSTMTPDENMGMRTRQGAPETPEDREAQTAYRTVALKGKLAYLEIRLITGRKHQIRAQAREAGCPVIGDDRYNQDGPDPLHRLGLHAWKLRLRHPVTGVPLAFESPLPGGFVAPANGYRPTRSTAPTVPKTVESTLPAAKVPPPRKGGGEEPTPGRRPSPKTNPPSRPKSFRGRAPGPRGSR